MSIINEHPLKIEDEHKNSFSSILKDLIDIELAERKIVTLSVDYFPLNILKTALEAAEIEIEQGILPFKTTMTITQKEIKIGDKTIELNNKLSVSKNAADWWANQLGHAFRKQNDLSSSQKMNR